MAKHTTTTGPEGSSVNPRNPQAVKAGQAITCPKCGQRGVKVLEYQRGSLVTVPHGAMRCRVIVGRL